LFLFGGAKVLGEEEQMGGFRGGRANGRLGFDKNEPGTSLYKREGERFLNG
jgi:hypothetical protein